MIDSDAERDIALNNFQFFGEQGMGETDLAADALHCARQAHSALQTDDH
ncbi:MAG: hypothetical protein QM775_04315 [Pirellulales bacterium]